LVILGILIFEGVVWGGIWFVLLIGLVIIGWLELSIYFWEFFLFSFVWNIILVSLSNRLCELILELLILCTKLLCFVQLPSKPKLGFYFSTWTNFNCEYLFCHDSRYPFMSCGARWNHRGKFLCNHGSTATVHSLPLDQSGFDFGCFVSEVRSTHNEHGRTFIFSFLMNISS
jgi:hypothetical protein